MKNVKIEVSEDIIDTGKLQKRMRVWVSKH